jgi:ParB family chromosome partitioning protein
MSVQQLEYQGVREVSPEELSPDPVRPVGFRSVPEQFVRSAREVGIVQPPLVRSLEGGLVIIDGTRRVRAAHKAGMESVEVIECCGDEVDVLSVWLSQHAEPFTKTVSDSDRASSLRKLVEDAEGDVRDWETTEAIQDAKYELGLLSDADVVKNELDGVAGIGVQIAENLVEEIGDISEIRAASEAELEGVPQVGARKASRINEYFNSLEHGSNVRIH